MEIIAAAAGEIIYKENNQIDKSCSFNSNRWNAVYIQHDDGSVAWYGHLKTGSATKKSVGEQVEVGEFLGVMGSSGNSTGPHLHFELYDAQGNLIDPYVGTCNTTTNESWWKEQQDYAVSGLNRVATH
ncbi:MAG: M23 family metallopeptidase, partial [Pseudomonadales bacterium]